MPRLLPRLLKWLERNPPSRPDYRGPLTKQVRRRPRSLWRPTRAVGDHAESFSFQDRHQSLLLDDNNIFTSSKQNESHKMLPPVLKLRKGEGLDVDHDTPREMSEQEKQWWSSPFCPSVLRMLCSSVRRCMLSQRHLPTDFLIRLAALKLPAPPNGSSPTVLVPDGLLHPKFSRRVNGNGNYLTCWNKALDTLIERGSFKRIVPNLSAHSLLSEQISHQLRLRVLQEVEVLCNQLKGAAPAASDDEVIIRRLSRSEWAMVRNQGKIPWESASFVVVVPPVNKDPGTRERSTPNTNGTLPESIDPGSNITNKPLPPLPPLSVLHPTEDLGCEEPLEFLRDTYLPHPCVPLYNGLSIFPSRYQRAALFQKLCELLNAERLARFKQPRPTSGSDKSSHAFIVFSSGKTLKRADPVPLAIALWRVRMWEGAGWGECGWLERK